jgi:hypothetical protein
MKRRLHPLEDSVASDRRIPRRWCRGALGTPALVLAFLVGFGFAFVVMRESPAAMAGGPIDTTAGGGPGTGTAGGGSGGATMAKSKIP